MEIVLQLEPCNISLKTFLLTARFASYTAAKILESYIAHRPIYYMQSDSEMSTGPLSVT